jgi:hypothetical protein
VAGQRGQMMAERARRREELGCDEATRSWLIDAAGSAIKEHDYLQERATEAQQRMALAIGAAAHALRTEVLCDELGIRANSVEQYRRRMTWQQARRVIDAHRGARS